MGFRVTPPLRRAIFFPSSHYTLSNPNQLQPSPRPSSRLHILHPMQICANLPKRTPTFPQGSITQVLADLQAKHQSIFTGQFFDEDDDEHTNEIREMVRLAACLSGRDKSGRTRPITQADVQAWVNDPAVEI